MCSKNKKLLHDISFLPILMHYKNHGVVIFTGDAIILLKCNRSNVIIIMFPTCMKKIPFSRSVKSWHAYPYSTCRQVKISFLGMPRLHIFKSKNEKAPYRGRGDTPLPHPPPARSLRSLAKIVPPQMFWLITPLIMTMLTYDCPTHVYSLL